MAGATATHRGISHSHLGLHHCSCGHRYCLPQVRTYILYQPLKKPQRTVVIECGKMLLHWCISFCSANRICSNSENLLAEAFVEKIFSSSWKKKMWLLQMSTLFACPPNHPRTVSVDCYATCEATECQISLLNLKVVNSFGQNATLLTGHSMVEQL